LGIAPCSDTVNPVVVVVMPRPVVPVRSTLQPVPLYGGEPNVRLQLVETLTPEKLILPCPSVEPGSKVPPEHEPSDGDPAETLTNFDFFVLAPTAATKVAN